MAYSKTLSLCALTLSGLAVAALPLDDPTPVPDPETTAAPETTAVPETSAAPDTTSFPDTTAALETTAAPETTPAPFPPSPGPVPPAPPAPAPVPPFPPSPPSVTTTYAPAPGPPPMPTPNATTTFAPAPGPPPMPPCGVRIQSTVSGLCVDLPGGNASDGALLQTWDCYGGETQQWAFQDGQLVYLPDPSKCVDLLGGDTTNGNLLGLWSCGGYESQMWGFDSQWGTIYLASSVASDASKCIQVGGENKGDSLVIWDCIVDPQLKQVWILHAVPEPSPVPEPTPAPEPSPEPGPSPAPDPAPAPAPGPAPKPPVGVQIQSTVSGLCVDLPGGNASDGALLWTRDCYGGDSQRWAFQDGQLVYLPDPSKCVDLLGGNTTNGNQLGLWSCGGYESQMWGFDPEWGTIYLASSAASDATKCIQIGGENTDSLMIWDCTVEPPQIWAVGPPQPPVAVV